MDGQVRKSRIKLSTHIDKDSDEIITNLLQQNAGKQPAQERIKRLQSHLKEVNIKKTDKERLVTKRSSRNSGWTNLSSTLNSNHSSTASPDTFVRCQTPRRASGIPADIPKQTTGFLASLRNFCFPEKAKPVQPEVKPQLPRAVATSHATSSRKYRAFAASSSSSTTHSGPKNAWAKPKALLDASNRLDRPCSLSANQRLALLRESLQQQQELLQKGANNNNNANKTTTTLPNKKSPATNASEIAQDSPMPADVQPNDDAEPMDIDWQEEEEALAKSSSDSGGTVITNSQLEMSLSVNKSLNKSQPEHNSDNLLQRLLATEQDLPARREDHMYFVLDTNVLMDNLVFVEDLCHLALAETNGSMLYIPYIVIKELDKLKDRHDDNKLKRTAAMRAIRYLNNKFDNSLKIQGQSALEEAEHLIEVDCPDDSIVNCCLQLQAQVPHLMLLTNDNNLRLKANASAIQVSCRSDLMNDYRSEFDALPT